MFIRHVEIEIEREREWWALVCVKKLTILGDSVLH